MIKTHHTAPFRTYIKAKIEDFVICCTIFFQWSCNEQEGSVLLGHIVAHWHCLVAVDTVVNLYAIKLVPAEFN